MMTVKSTKVAERQELSFSVAVCCECLTMCQTHTRTHSSHSENEDAAMLEISYLSPSVIREESNINFSHA